jgi:TPR repeat protein
VLLDFFFYFSQMKASSLQKKHVTGSSLRSKVISDAEILTTAFDRGFLILRNIREAAENGDSYAQWLLGQCYFHGSGVCKNLKEAVKWLRLAADQDHVLAQTAIAHCYFCGWGVQLDRNEAAKWFRVAADKGYAPAQTCLGQCYANGLGVNKDQKEANEWFHLAADQNYTPARNLIKK